MALLERTDAPTGLLAAAVRVRLHLEDLEHTISPEMLDRFAAGSATPGERRVVVRHLLQGCAACSRHLERYLPPEPDEEAEDAYDLAFERSLDRAFEALSQKVQ